MKRLGFLILFVSLCYFSFSQTGWRKGEMEIKVHINSQKQADQLHVLNFDAEQASPDGSVINVYVIPSELEVISKNGFSYEISIPDLNAHYDHFWDRKVPGGYMTYEQIVALADSLATNFPGICQKVIFGTSYGGRQLAALKISDNVNIEEPEAGILFDAGIHGDEILPSDIVMRYSRYLCLGYGTDPVVTDMINNHEIWFYYMVNPDGRVNMNRYNNHNVDCNRDAGYMWNGEGGSPGAFSQIESQSLRNCMLQVNPVVYTNYHGGTEIISYPWSYRSSPCPDNANLNQLASVYSSSSGYTGLIFGQGYNIMYPINGSNKDFQYGGSGNVGWSIELSNDKQPPSSQITSFYNKNAPAITEIIKRCGYGVEGIVTDSITGDPLLATVWVDNFYPVITRPGPGDYHKYILPGTHTIKVMANGYITRVINNVVVPAEGSVITNFLMKRQTASNAVQVMSSRIQLADFSSFTNAAYTPGTIGVNDNIYYSLWKSGWIVLDMGDTIYNGPGNDFRIYEGGSDGAEGFTCYAGSAKDGPWMEIGTGTGTSVFDLANATGGTVGKTRYLKIVDDGDGQTVGVDLGFDLDAVEMITQPLIPGFVASDKTPCPGNSINFSDYTRGTPVSWSWEFQGGTPSTSTDQNPQNILYTQPGTYNVTLKVTNAYCTNTRIRTGYITVPELPVVNLGNDTSIVASQSLVLDAGFPGSSYLWSTGDTTQTISVDSTGTGFGTATYWVDIVDPYGCPASDTINVTYTVGSGLNPVVASLINIYPNPLKEIINLEYKGIKIDAISLVSLMGTTVFETKTISPSGHESINTTNLPRGIYLLEIISSGKKEIRKLILE